MISLKRTLYTNAKLRHIKDIIEGAIPDMHRVNRNVTSIFSKEPSPTQTKVKAPKDKITVFAVNKWHKKARISNYIVAQGSMTKTLYEHLVIMAS